MEEEEIVLNDSNVEAILQGPARNRGSKMSTGEPLGGEPSGIIGGNAGTPTGGGGPRGTSKFASITRDKVLAPLSPKSPLGSGAGSPKDENYNKNDAAGGGAFTSFLDRGSSSKESGSSLPSLKPKQDFAQVVKMASKEAAKNKAAGNNTLLGDLSPPSTIKSLRKEVVTTDANWLNDVEANKRESLVEGAAFAPSNSLCTVEILIPLEEKKAAVRCLVDTGSQLSFLSTDTVEKLGLWKIVDQSWARPVGSLGGGSSSKGQIHYLPLCFNQFDDERNYFTGSFQVLDLPPYEKSFDALIGLDFLLRNNAKIDFPRSRFEVSRKMAMAEIPLKVVERAIKQEDVQ